MNAWIQKELRILAPSFAACFLFSLAAGLLPRQQHFAPLGLLAILLLALCPLLLLHMSLDSFGREVSAGMLPMLLAQPIGRKRLWWTKTSLLAVAAGAAWWNWWKSFIHHTGGNLPQEVVEMMKVSSMLFVAVVVAGGLWTVLAFRQVSAALWFTLLSPLTLIAMTSRLAAPWSGHLNQVIAWVLAVYALAGVAWAHRLFLRLEDRGSAQESVSFSQGSLRLPRFLQSSAPTQPRGAAASLVWKEINLHHSLLMLAAILAALHLGMIALRSWDHGMHVAKDSILEVITGGLWVFWLVFPLVIGAGLFAEERRLGVWESQLCLPIHRRRQLLVKAGVGLLLALILGAAIPVLLEWNRILPEQRFDPHAALLVNPDIVRGGGGLASRVILVLARFAVALPFDPQPLFLLGFCSAAVFLIATYSSSLSRSLLQSLTGSVAGLFFSVLLLLWLQFPGWGTRFQTQLFHGPIGFVIVIPLLAATLICLITLNARQVRLSARTRWANLAVIIAVLVGGNAATGMVYHRFWEHLTALEPAHGTALLKPTDRLQLQRDWNTIALSSGDGRSWTAGLVQSDPELWNRRMQTRALRTPIAQLQGSNWLQVALSAYETVGIQRDGSLWASGNPFGNWPPSLRPNGTTPSENAGSMSRYGTETNWKGVVRFHQGVLLLKTDGTLWEWTLKQVRSRADIRSLLTVAPRQLAVDDDWSELRPHPDRRNAGDFVLRKKDGRAWQFLEWQPFPFEGEDSDNITLDAQATLKRVPALDSGHIQRSVQALSRIGRPQMLGAGFGQFQVSLGNDGGLVVSGILEPVGRGHQWGLRTTHYPLRDTAGSRWIDIASDMETMITLREDGTLWKWRFDELPTNSSAKCEPIQMGTHSDWVALIGHGRELMSLAADGSLWLWDLEHPLQDYSQTFLAPSAKPRHLGNLLK